MAWAVVGGVIAFVRYLSYTLVGAPRAAAGLLHG